MTTTLSDETLEQIFDYLGDREIFFPTESGNVFSGGVEQMKAVFSYINLKDGNLYLQLSKKARRYDERKKRPAQGQFVEFIDVMGHLDECPVEGSGKAAMSLFLEDEEYEVTGYVDIQ